MTVKIHLIIPKILFKSMKIIIQWFCNNIYKILNYLFLKVFPNIYIYISLGKMRKKIWRNPMKKIIVLNKTKKVM